jgi:hypothetical protein
MCPACGAVVVQAVDALCWLTVKNESPGPKMMDGRMIVAVGSVWRKVSSAAALVLQLRRQRVVRTCERHRWVMCRTLRYAGSGSSHLDPPHLDLPQLDPRRFVLRPSQRQRLHPGTSSCTPPSLSVIFPPRAHRRPRPR